MKQDETFKIQTWAQTNISTAWAAVNGFLLESEAEEDEDFDFDGEYLDEEEARAEPELLEGCFSLFLAQLLGGSNVKAIRMLQSVAAGTLQNEEMIKAHESIHHRIQLAKNQHR